MKFMPDPFQGLPVFVRRRAAMAHLEFVGICMNFERGNDLKINSPGNAHLRNFQGFQRSILA